jgi:hypothetical protein
VRGIVVVLKLLTTSNGYACTTVWNVGLIVHVFIDVVTRLVCTRNGGWPACGDGGNPI